MIRIGRYVIVKTIYILLDIAVMVLSLYLVCLIRQETLPFTTTFYNLFFYSSNPYRFIFLFWIVVTIFFNNAYGLYQTKREIFETIEVWKVLKSVCLASLIIIVTVFVVRISYFPRSIVVLNAFIMFMLLSIWRIAKRIFVEFLVMKGYNNFNVLIIGAGKIGKTLAQEIYKKPALGLNIIGYLDDTKEINSDIDGIKILGKISNFNNIARREFINKIFIAHYDNSEAFLTLLEEAKNIGVAVRVVPHGFELMSGEFSKYNIGLIPILEYCDAERSYKQVGKRLFDFLTTVVMATFAIPVFFVIALIIKIDSPGPIFYLSKRYGRSGRMFKMLKFRSMCADADHVIDQMREQNEVDGPIFKIKKDPRITKFGNILRKCSMDELPQLFNVIKGDMSLVGPRPLPISQVEREDFRQLQRLEVRPGITGLWQIRGRSDISFARLVKWDVWYIKNWSFWLDLNILLKTIPVVIKGRGAY